MKQYNFTMNTLVLLAAAASTFLSSLPIAAADHSIISWIRSMGGMVSKKIEIKRHPIGYMGVFAREDIGRKEGLFRIPRECYIEIFDMRQTVSPAESYSKHNNELCQLANKLTKEMNAGEESQFAPYTAYLETQTPGQIPATWSEEGKDLMRKIDYPTAGYSMVDWISWNFTGYSNTKKCIPSDDPFQEHMVAMTVQRGYDVALIPLWDMVNHDNGRLNTENDSMYNDNGLEVRASKPIKAGEEIFATYDKCLDCANTAFWWGTPEILRDFGFVEGYPHRWVWSERGIWFEVDSKKRTERNDQTDFDDELLVFFEEESSVTEPFLSSTHGDSYKFDSDYTDPYGIPNPSQIQFLQDEVSRLIEVGETALKEQGNVPDREWQIINEFHAAAVTDISAAINYATQRNSVMNPEDLEDSSDSSDSEDTIDTTTPLVPDDSSKVEL